MLGQELLGIWEMLPLNPDAQLKTVRDYAARVLGSELSAAGWLGRANAAVLDGACVVSEACQTRAGFQAAMLELIRMSYLGQNVARAPEGQSKRLDRTAS